MKNIVNGKFFLVYCDEILKGVSEKISISVSLGTVNEKVYEVLRDYIVSD